MSEFTIPDHPVKTFIVRGVSFTFGPPKRPNTKHDDGFLDKRYNYKTRKPTKDDYKSLAKWKLRLAAVEQGWIVSPKGRLLGDRPDYLKEAGAAYRHYLYGKGQDRYFSYERYIWEDPHGKLTLENILVCVREAVDLIYDNIFNNKGSAKFQITSEAVCREDINPYPATENWQKAIGGHTIWISADVDITSLGGSASFSSIVTLHSEDRYNFDPGKQDIATGIPDAVNGTFQLTGLAMQYMNYGVPVVRRLHWTSDRTLQATIKQTKAEKLGQAIQQYPR